MSFASPVWLLFLGLVPLIVILHALAVRWRSTPVSSLVFWNEVLREKKASIRIRRLLRNLALLLEVLAAAALAVGLAGPRVSRAGFSGPGDTILVLDVTASMKTREGSRTRFDLARSRALDVLSQLRGGARMAIIAAARSPRVAAAFSADREALRRAIRAVAATDEPGDLADGLRLALSLRDARRGDQVVVVTDGAFDSLGGIDTSLPWMHLIVVGSARDNVGITGLAFRRTVSGQEAYEMFLALHNDGPAAVSVPLTITAERGVVLSRQEELASGQDKTISIPWTGPTTGRVEARIQTGDDFPVDDRAFAVFAAARPLRVLVVGPNTYFIQKALGSLPGVTVRAAAQPPAVPTDQPGAVGDDVVVYVGVQPPAVESGSYLFFDTAPPNLPVQVTGSLRLPPVTGWSRSEPLLDSVSLSGLAIGQALRLQPGPGFTTLAVSRESPLMLAWDQPGLKALLVAFDPAQSDLPLRPAFPVLLANALSWFFPSWLSLQADQVQAGSPRAIPGSAAGSVVVKPDGTRETVPGSSQSAEFLDTDEVGYYRVESAASGVSGVSGAGAGGAESAGYSAASEFAVNLASASESAIAPRFSPGVSGAAEGQAAAVSPAAAAPIPIWSALALAGLALILAEWLVWLRTPQGARR